MAINAENKVFAADFKFPILVAGTAKEKIVMMDVKNNQARVIVDSSDLGQYSQLQSLVISSKCATFGLGTVDGRANISSITHSTLGTLTNVLSLLLRNPSSLSRATNANRQARPSSIL